MVVVSGMRSNHLKFEQENIADEKNMAAELCPGENICVGFWAGIPRVNHRRREWAVQGRLSAKGHLPWADFSAEICARMPRYGWADWSGSGDWV